MALTTSVGTYRAEWSGGLWWLSGPDGRSIGDGWYSADEVKAAVYGDSLARQSG